MRYDSIALFDAARSFNGFARCGFDEPEFYDSVLHYDTVDCHIDRVYGRGSPHGDDDLVSKVREKWEAIELAQARESTTEPGEADTAQIPRDHTAPILTAAPQTVAAENTILRHDHEQNQHDRQAKQTARRRQEEESLILALLMA